MSDSNRYLNTFLQRLKQGNKIGITTKSNLRYFTNEIEVLGDSILFEDKFGNSVFLSISEIGKLEEVRNGK